MKKNNLNLFVFLSASFFFQAFGNGSFAQESQNPVITETRSEKTWTSISNMDGIAVSLLEEELFEGSKLLSIGFVNTLENEANFSWSIEGPNGIIFKGKDLTLSSGQEVKSMNIVELKGTLGISSCIIKLKIN